MNFKNTVTCLLLAGTIVISITGCRVQTEFTARDMDMHNVQTHAERKQRFFDFLRPIIEQENRRILALRQSLLAAKMHNNRKAFVSGIARSYTVNWDPGNENWDKLLERVDAIPVEIALAQSAIETNWGKSRFALQGNNFFGQWCLQKNCGIVPEKRSRNQTHEVARFDSVNASVRSYLKNINTARAYYSLRKLRRMQREAGEPVNPVAMAGGLVNYSQRRYQYVNAIKRLIVQDSALMLGS
jgi:Bax protein